MGVMKISLVLLLLAAICQGHDESCWKTRKEQKYRRLILKDAACMRPRGTLIKLPVPEGYDYVYPGAIVVRKCSGNCKTQNVECVATDITVKNITVEAHKIDDGLAKKCTHAKVVEHLSCGCKCEKTNESCSSNEKFNKQMCRCECKPELEIECRNRMETMPGKVMWNKDTCSCPCNNVQGCSSGEVWVDQYCKCMIVMSNDATTAS